MNTDRHGVASARTMTLEAFADTVVPGEKRWDGDRTGPGIVRAARERGVAVEYGPPAPDGSTGGRRGVLSLATTLQHG